MCKHFSKEFVQVSGQVLVWRLYDRVSGLKSSYGNIYWLQIWLIKMASKSQLKYKLYLAFLRAI